MDPSGAIGSGSVIVRVGSRVTCNPPPTDTDEDYLVYVKDAGSAVKALRSVGFEFSSTPEQIERYESMGPSGSFTSLWFGELNYIVTDDWLFFERFLTATHVCKTLNLLDKKDRILVFGAIRGDSYSHEVEGGMKAYQIEQFFKEKRPTDGWLSSVTTLDQVDVRDAIKGRNWF